MKKPKSPYFLFCDKQMEEIKNKGDNKKLTAKELGDMWLKLPEEKKKVFYDEYNESQKKKKNLRLKKK